MLELISCPFCKGKENSFWATDNGFKAVKCNDCGFVFVNPRPKNELINKAVITGMHSEEANFLNVVTKMIPKKVDYYEKVFKGFFYDDFKKQNKISWLDVGAGFGEIVEAVERIAPSNSYIIGVEPMKPKVEDANLRGLKIKNGYIDSIDEKFQYISLINVFSHIPDFTSFLKDLKERLLPDGEIILETGNAADLESKSVPGDLSLPDHLIFAGEKHIIGFLEREGFNIIEIKRYRIDTFLGFIKDVIKKIIGKNVNLVFPYSSSYRSLFIRARLNKN
jgi:2-polyprenyl-3-methyl-5-hydroxy-6-metoxy-1,4-benzoquinol methylase